MPNQFENIEEWVAAYLTYRLTDEEATEFQQALQTDANLQKEYEFQLHLKAGARLTVENKQQARKEQVHKLIANKHQKQRRIYLLLFFLFAVSISFFIYQSLNSADNFKAEQKVHDSLADARSNEKQVNDSLADARSNKKQVNDSLADARSNKKQVNDSLADARSNEKQKFDNATTLNDDISQIIIKDAKQIEQEKVLYAKCMKELIACNEKMSGFMNQDTLSLENISVAKVKEELAKLSKNKEGRLALYQKVMTIKAQSAKRLIKCQNSLEMCRL